MKNGILAFCGPKFSGKSTATSLVQELLPGKTEEIVFAGRIKTVCSEVFGLDMKYMLDPKLKESELDNWVILNPDNIRSIIAGFDITSINDDLHVRPHIGQVFETPRKMMQYVGTEIMRNIDQDVHVKYALAHKDLSKLSLISDLRFESEYTGIASLPNVLTVHVVNTKAANSGSKDQHPSETDYLKFASKCEQLDNNGSIADLRRNVSSLLQKFYE